MKKRAARPLFFIDLALPRDVDAGVAGLANVYLYNLDDLAAIAEQNRTARAAEIDKCRHLLSERAAALWQQIEPRLQPAGTAAAGQPQVRGPEIRQA
jgi:glutamyl-tRNA reductase